MRIRAISVAVTLLAVTLSSAGYTKAQSPAGGASSAKPGGSSGVNGSGTPGTLAKWGGTTTLSSSVITEDKFGLVGVGTATPTSRLTVVGAVESKFGGFKFPDGTVQVTAGLTPDQAVTSLNGLRGDVTLAAGENITLAVLGSSIRIDAAGLLAAVATDETLVGDGTAAAPLAVAVPLSLSAGLPGEEGPVLRVENLVGRSSAVQIFGGSDADAGGLGLGVAGGDGNSGDGGIGIAVIGGSSNGGSAGAAILATGGENFGNSGVAGVIAVGGESHGAGNTGGSGIFAIAGFGLDGAEDGLAGDFNDDVAVDGDLDVTGTKNFKIDHPLDPENKYLRHAAVESSEVLNVYSGNIVTDGSGEATVTLPEWFGAVNTDLRYQLTVVGTFAQAIVAKEVENNRFTIRTDAPNVKVSWEVTGVRSDAAMRKRPFVAEEEKPASERGSYLTPEAFDQPEEKGVHWVRNPELMKQVKQARERAGLKADGSR